MGMRRVAFVLGLSVLPAIAHADRHFADLMVGRFKAKGSDFDGMQYSGSWPILPCFDLSLVGTFGRYTGKEGKEGEPDEDQAEHTLATYIIGVRWTQHWKVRGYELLPFGQFLWGKVDNTRKLDDDGLAQVATHTAYVVGLGVQPSIKIAHDKFRLRAQVDLFHRTKKDLGSFRPGGWGFAYSLGLMYQFGPEFACGEKCLCDCPCPPSTTKSSVRLVAPERLGPLAPGERFAMRAR